MWIVAVLFTGFLGGWLCGASGRWQIARALRVAEVNNDLLEARVSLLHAEMSLGNADLRATSRHLDNVGTAVARGIGRFDAAGLTVERQRLDLSGVDAEIELAQRLLARLTEDAARATGAQNPAWSARVTWKP